MLDKNTEALLMEYAAGSLDHAHRIIVTAYLTLSPDARRFVFECEKIGGALIEAECGEAPLSAGCLEAVLAKIDCGSVPCSEVLPKIAASLEAAHPVPQPLARLIPHGAQLHWQTLAHGVHVTVLQAGPCHSELRLIRFGPGATFARRGRRNPAVTLILEGSVSEGHGHYQRGEIVVSDPGSHQVYRAHDHDGCLCFTVTGRSPRYAALWARVFGAGF